MAELDDPLKPLREDAISEEIIRPVSELLVTDLLVGTGRARAIHEFRLAAPVQGHRKLILSWEVPNRYSSDPLTIRLPAISSSDSRFRESLFLRS